MSIPPKECSSFSHFPPSTSKHRANTCIRRAPTYTSNFLVHSSQWRQAIRPRASPMISLNIIFLCVPWGNVRSGLIGDNLSKKASMQEAHEKWWLLMNVAWQHGPFSFVFPVYLPSYSWKKHPFENRPVCFFHCLITPMHLWRKGYLLPLFISCSTKKKVTFQIGSWGSEGKGKIPLPWVCIQRVVLSVLYIFDS